jgi:hypothetical protein
MENAVFWEVRPCRYCVNRRFGGSYLHLEVREIRERGTRLSRWLQRYVPAKRRLTQYLHCATFFKRRTSLQNKETA